MSENSEHKTLKKALLAGSLWDLIGAIIFIVIHGILQKQLTPEIYPFYSIVIGIFLLVLSYLQFITSTDIRRYCSHIGVVIGIRINWGQSKFKSTINVCQLLEVIRNNIHKGMAVGNDRFKEELAFLTGRRLKSKNAVAL